MYIPCSIKPIIWLCTQFLKPDSCLVRSFLWVWVKSLKPKNDETVVSPERYPKNPNPYHESSILGAAVPVLSGFFLLPRSDVPTYRLGKKKTWFHPQPQPHPKKPWRFFQVAMQEISLVATVSPVLAVGEKKTVGKPSFPVVHHVLHVKNYPCYLGCRKRPHVAWYQKLAHVGARVPYQLFRSVPSDLQQKHINLQLAGHDFSWNL